MPEDKTFQSKQYKLSKLDLADLSSNPFLQFDKWFNEALESDEKFPNAMVLSTVNSSHKPSSRVVLLKGYSESGYRFYTNCNSNKGKDIEVNKGVSLCFWWSLLERQIRIDGKVELLSDDITDEYFDSRPRQSKISAWISDQSEILDSRKKLEKEFIDFEKESEGKKISRPSFWKGYNVVPDLFEFWQGRDNRLHDRFRYILSDTSEWKIDRLYP